MLNQITSQMQKWTPFSVLVILITLAAIFVLVWDLVHNEPIPGFLYAFLSLLAGSGGTGIAVSHGVKVANGVASNTAKAMMSEIVQTGSLPEK